VWCEDEAGPFPAVPQPGSSWQGTAHPATPPQEWIRGGTTKVRTLLEPAPGTVDVPPAARVTNLVLPAWREEERERKLAALPSAVPGTDPEAHRKQWAAWQEGLSVRFTWPEQRPA
jgi:hypothetical protein